MNFEIIIAVASLFMGLITAALSVRWARKSIHRAAQSKSLELRGELRKLLNEVRLDIAQLPIDISSYCNTWQMYWTTKDMGSQSVAKIAGIEASRDGAELTKLREALPNEEGHEKLSETGLEELIDKVHWAKIRVERLVEKYAKKAHDLEMERRRHQEELLANRRVRQQDLLARHGDVNSAESLLRRNDILEGRF